MRSKGLVPVADQVSAEAPAKVNLVLEVLGKREDGYHEVDTILQTLELADTVTLDFDPDADVLPVSVSGPFAAGCPADTSNLAWRAAEELARQCGRPLGHLGMHLEKRIPAAGGLGGGASDAAAVIRLLRARWPEVTDAMALAAAASVGSDVPFFLVGGTARARGRGERVEPLPPVAPQGVVLFVPGATLERKTARLFAALDGQPFDDGRHASVAGARAAGMPVLTPVYNAFGRVAVDVFPGLDALRHDLEHRLGEPISLAGAGPVLFWMGPPPARARIVAIATGAACTIIPTMTAEAAWKR